MPKLSITCANAVYHRLSKDAQTEGKLCLLHLNHDCHAVEKRVTIPLRHLQASLWSAITRGTKEYM